MNFSDLEDFKDLTGTMYPSNMFLNARELTSLKGSPDAVNGDFFCSNNKLTTLKYSPKEIFGNFNVNYNNLISLEGSPKNVEENFIMFTMRHLRSRRRGIVNHFKMFDCCPNLLYN